MKESKQEAADALRDRTTNASKIAAFNVCAEALQPLRAEHRAHVLASLEVLFETRKVDDHG